MQGGGALGAYQAGVYEALAEANIDPDWVAGVSIGAINSAIIAGNEPAERVAKLRSYEGEKAWAEHLAAGKAADTNRAKLKAQRLARDAAEKPTTSKGARKQKPPKGEEISSQGQVDEGTKRRTGARAGQK